MQHSWFGETDSHSPPEDVRDDAVNSSPGFAPVTVTTCGKRVGSAVRLGEVQMPNFFLLLSEKWCRRTHARPSRIANRISLDMSLYSEEIRGLPEGAPRSNTAGQPTSYRTLYDCTSKIFADLCFWPRKFRKCN